MSASCCFYSCRLVYNPVSQSMSWRLNNLAILYFFTVPAMDWLASCFCAGWLFVYCVISIPYVSVCSYILYLYISADITYTLYASSTHTCWCFSLLPLTKTMTGGWNLLLCLNYCITYQAMDSCCLSSSSTGCCYCGVLCFCVTSSRNCLFLSFPAAAALSCLNPTLCAGWWLSYCPFTCEIVT